MLTTKSTIDVSISASFPRRLLPTRPRIAQVQMCCTALWVTYSILDYQGGKMFWPLAVNVRDRGGPSQDSATLDY